MLFVLILYVCLVVVVLCDTLGFVVIVHVYYVGCWLVTLVCWISLGVCGACWVTLCYLGFMITCLSCGLWYDSLLNDSYSLFCL